MKDFRAAAHVRPYYPDAILATQLVKAFCWYAKLRLGVDEERIALLTSVCSDDLNSVSLPDTDMVGPFILGGLDGYPFVGKTGLGAFSHHIPEHGAALLFFGPHVGITNTGEVGLVVRPGQSAPSSCCGAAAAGLSKLVAGGITLKDPCDFDVEDYQQETLEQLLLRNESEILGSGPPDNAQRFVRMTEVIYRESKQSFFDLLRGIEFEEPAFLFGGILINVDGGAESSIALRDAVRLQHGRFEDWTGDFREQSEAQFRSIEAGNADAFH